MMAIKESNSFIGIKNRGKRNRNSHKCFSTKRSFSSGPHFVRTLHCDLSILGGLHVTTHSFIELDKTVIHVISLVSFLELWFSFCLPSEVKSLVEDS